MSALLRADLAYTRTFARNPCFDIWEEEQGLHYYTLRVAAAALEQGAQWLEQHDGQPEGAGLPHRSSCHPGDAGRLLASGPGLLPLAGTYQTAVRSEKELDIAVILATLHAAGDGCTHSVRDARMHATLARLAAVFDTAYPINHGRPATRAPALGRYIGDTYYSGGAYYFSTLAAAEFYFRAAVGSTEARERFERGDAYLETVRAFTPASGDMSEQFDQRTGMQTSAKQLAWSYAAFITCIHARRACSRS